MAIRIRLATAEDQPASQRLVISTICKVNSKDYTRKQIRQWSIPNRRPWKQKRNGQPIRRLVAFDGTRLVGVAFGLNAQLHSIRGLYVAHTHLQHGVGSRLLKMMEKWAINLGWKEIRVASTLTAVPFYEKMGYAKTRKGSYRLSNGLSIPCVHMKKRLS